MGHSVAQIASPLLGCTVSFPSDRPALLANLDTEQPEAKQYSNECISQALGQAETVSEGDVSHECFN